MVVFWSNRTVQTKQPDDPPEEIQQLENGADAVHCACLLSQPTSQRTGSRVGSTAPVERGPSQGARSGSKEPTWLSVLPLPHFTFRPPPEADDIVLVFDPDQRADQQ